MKKINEELLVHTPVFDLVKKTFEETNFQPVGLNCNDWCMIIALDRNENTIVVKQTRWGSEKKTIEFPCGMVEKGEAPKDAALREFKEETGIEIEPSQLNEIAKFNPNPAYFNNTMHVFLIDSISDLIEAFEKRGEQHLDKDEDCIPLVEKLDDVLMDEISKHAIGLAALAALYRIRKLKN